LEDPHKQWAERVKPPAVAEQHGQHPTSALQQVCMLNMRMLRLHHSTAVICCTERCHSR
jgi:hypothetical protein